MASVTGIKSWRADQDDDGFRTYRVTYGVRAAVTESPVAVMTASGLPAYGTAMMIPGYSGVDAWCWRRPEMSVTIDQERTGDNPEYYLVEVVFSNKYENWKSKRCCDTQITDPMLEPMKLSGSFTMKQREAKYDRNGVRLVTSANEPLTGAGVTFEYECPTVHVEQNVASLGLSTYSTMVNAVNASPLWGVPARCVRLARASWERKVWGTCNYFYIRTFDFEIDYYNQDKDGNVIGWDRELYDSGGQCLRGEWITDTEDANYGAFKLLSSYTYTEKSTILQVPQGQFQAYKDMNNENSRGFLDGHGRPANSKILDKDGLPVTGSGYNVTPFTDSGAMSGPPAHAVCEYYREVNFLLLGIPTSF